MILSSNKVLPSDPGDPIELTTRHYPYPFLPYSPIAIHEGYPFRRSPGISGIRAVGLELVGYLNYLNVPLPSVEYFRTLALADHLRHILLFP